MKQETIEIVGREQEVKRMESTALSWPSRAQAIVVRDQESYDAAASLVVEIVTLERQIIEHHKPIKEAAFAAHRVACAAEKKLLDPIQQAKGIIKGAIGTWEREQERIRLEAQRKAEEEQRRIEEEERLNLAIEAEQAGACEETTQEILSTPVVVMPRPVVAPTFQRAAGVSTSQRWKAECIDIRALCKAIAEGRVSSELVQPNMVALSAMARAMKATFNVAGCRAVTETSVGVRT